jgi:hypothetical protein
MPSASGQSRVPASWKNGERRCSRHLVCVCTQYEFARCTLIAQSRSPVTEPTGLRCLRAQEGRRVPAARLKHPDCRINARAARMGMFPQQRSATLIDVDVGKVRYARNGDVRLAYRVLGGGTTHWSGIPGGSAMSTCTTTRHSRSARSSKSSRKQRGSSCGTNGERDLSRAGPFLGAVRRRRTVLSRASRPSVGFDPPIRSTNTEVRSKALG